MTEFLFQQYFPVFMFCSLLRVIGEERQTILSIKYNDIDCFSTKSSFEISTSLAPIELYQNDLSLSLSLVCLAFLDNLRTTYSIPSINLSNIMICTLLRLSHIALFSPFPLWLPSFMMRFLASLFIVRTAS